MEDAIEEFDLLDGKLFAVFTEEAGELIDVGLCSRINPETKRHTPLLLGTSIDADQSILEGLRVVFDGVAGLQAPMGFIQRIYKINALLFGEHGYMDYAVVDEVFEMIAPSRSGMAFASVAGGSEQTDKSRSVA
jgi:hypothetical protein